MTCWTPSSGRRALLVFAVIAAVACGSCRHAPIAAPGEGAASLRGTGSGELLRVAMLPLYNLSGGTPPLGQLRAVIETEVARQGFEVVSGEPVNQFLARHRVRHTGGISAQDAKRAREELDVDAILISAVTSYASEPQPALGFHLRLVSATDAAILWVAQHARGGSDSPGLLNLGIVSEESRLQRITLEPIMSSLRDFRRGNASSRAVPCDGGRRFAPKLAFRSPEARILEGSRFAVLPFLNDSQRRDAAEIVGLALVHQLAAEPGVRVIEPGALREVLLNQRLIIENGVTIDVARQVLGALESEYVLAGRVYDYADAAGFGTSVASVNFSATLLEARTGKIVWQSTSYAHGDDGVHFFGRGTVKNGPNLACRMSRMVVDRMVGEVDRSRGPGSGEWRLGERRHARAQRRP